MRLRVAAVCLILLAFHFSNITLAQEVPKKMMQYGVKTVFVKNKDILFPDFSLIYLGERHVKSPVFKPGFIFFDFMVKNNYQENRISWSSGTGEISPHKFKVSGNEFYLELKLSDKLVKLKSDELVIWKAKGT